jgi:hypothetical protein
MRVRSDRRNLHRLLCCLIFAIGMCLPMAVPASAGADFGLKSADVIFTQLDATPSNPYDNPMVTQAGSHPGAMTTTIALNYSEPGFFALDGGQLKDLVGDLIPGLLGNATAMPRCSTIDFLTLRPTGETLVECPDNTAIGAVGVNFIAPAPYFYLNAPVYNLEPPPGIAAEMGFNILNVRVTIDVGVKAGGDHLVAMMHNTPQTLTVFGATLQLWGDPSDPRNDPIRGVCIGGGITALSFGEINLASGSTGSCSVGPADKPFLALPGVCSGPLTTTFAATSWMAPEVSAATSVLTHDGSTPPNPAGFTGCGKLAFAPSIASSPTTEASETGSGLDLDVDFNDEGFSNPEGLIQSQTKKAVVTLPEGMTINPSVGEGLGVCSPADFDRETLRSDPGDGCPNSSKIGTLHVDSPIAEEGIDGSVYLAEQDDPTTSEPGKENPFDSLIALYLVLKNTNLGAMVKKPLKVEPDPQTGQLVATLDDIPQLPFSHFSFHFKEGQRAPLVTPPACGTYTTEAKFWPWADPDNPRTVTSSFEITEGVGGGSCPPSGIPPFKPDFEAGAINNNAGSFSPFNMRLIREDGEQNMTKFSSILPPGQVGSLVGIAKCSDAAVAIAKSKTGRQELASSSCPANSEIGHTLAGAGVGSALTYVAGKIYLGGPYKGAPLSVIAITPAVAGPFDAGTVAIRLGLTLNPRTAEVEVDGSASDPIPHILNGIVLKLRDLRVDVDRPNFIINPTSCDPSSTKATLFGSYLDVFNPADDVPVHLSTRYQAADCLNLGFKPKLSLSLKGGVRRGGHPGLKAIYTPRPGDANLKGLVVRLPRSAFLDQAHIRTICTRVQFAADSCPPAAQYGFIKAWTPLLEEPLEGPAWLRSSDHKLPDLVFDLHGLVDVEVSTRIDSAQGGIRARLDSAPDAPLSKVELTMQGGRKSLIVNSRNLCGVKSRANVQFAGHNGKQSASKPVMRARCGKKRKAKRSSHGRASRARVAGASSVG